MALYTVLLREQDNTWTPFKHNGESAEPLKAWADRKGVDYKIECQNGERVRIVTERTFGKRVVRKRKG